MDFYANDSLGPWTPNHKPSGKAKNWDYIGKYIGIDKQFKFKVTTNNHLCNLSNLVL